MVNWVEIPIADCDDSPESTSFAVLSSLKKRLFSYRYVKTFYCNIEGGKSFPNGGLWGH